MCVLCQYYAGFFCFVFSRFTFMCMGVLPADKVCAPQACSAYGGHKRASDSPELELQTVVNLHVVWESNPVHLNCLLSSPCAVFLTEVL